MNDYISIITVLVIIAIYIIGIIKRLNVKNENTPTAEESVIEANPKERQRRNPLRPNSFNRGNDIKAQTTRSNLGHSTHSKHSAEEIKCEENGVKSPIIEDFDPKKAVVWSEILKPKFEEE